MPTERTKGIVICRTAFGNLLVGPTAEDQEIRDIAAVDEAALAMLIAKGDEMLPGLADIGVNAVYAGLRPATAVQGLPDRSTAGAALDHASPASARPG